MTDGYNIFAKYYDELMANVDYEGILSFIDKAVKGYKLNGNNILVDIACGTGTICEHMSELGYDVIGIDFSEDMLSCAYEKKLESGNNIQYICQDMRNIDLYGTAGVFICVLDSINHLGGFEDVCELIERVSMFIENGGVLIFDMNTPYKHREVLGDNVFVYETGNVYCVWENSFYEEDNEVEISLNFFEREGNIYRRYVEIFSERAYDINRIDDVLKRSGFEIIGHYDDYKLMGVSAETERVTFIARKCSNGRN